MFGIALNSDEILFKYIGGLHSYLRHTLLLFDVHDLDKVYVQATHLEARDKSKDQDLKGKKQVNAITKKDDKKDEKKDKGHCTHCNVDGHTDAKCWKLHPEKAPKWFGKNQEKRNALASKGKEICCIDDASEIDEQMNCMGVKNSYELSEEDKRLELFHIKVQAKKPGLMCCLTQDHRLILLLRTWWKIWSFQFNLIHTHIHSNGCTRMLDWQSHDSVSWSLGLIQNFMMKCYCM